MAAPSQDDPPPEPSRSVVHVLPHPGGGGDTYVDTLASMGGYRSGRCFVARSPEVRRPDRLVSGAFRANQASRAHDLLHVHGEIAGLLCLTALARRPSILTLHGLNLLRRSSGAKRRLAKLNLRLLVRAADRTICVSEAERDELCGVVGTALARRVVLIRNGIDLPGELAPETRRDLRAELGVSEAAVVAACVGELEPLKDPVTVARAALATSGETEIVVCFAGDGSLRPHLERLAAGEGGSALRILGHRDDVERLYAAADIIVLASHREGLPFALLEGMSYGLVPVVSDVPGCLEAGGDAAVVAGCGDVAGFAAAFRELAADARERAARGARARDRVARLFPASEMVERTRLLYDEVS